MKLRVLAMNADIVVGSGGLVEPCVADAIRSLRSAGVLTVLVSQRALSDIQPLLSCRDVAAVVAEGGAVVRMSDGTSDVVLAPGPDAALVAELERAGVPHRKGTCMVEVAGSAARDAMTALHALRSPHGITFGVGTVAVLPPGVSKAMGVGEAVWRLGASLHNTVAIGCSDDDRSMLDACEVAVVVASSSTALRRSADHVLAASGSAAVAQSMVELAAAAPATPPRERGSRRRLRVGTRDTGQPVDIATDLQNVLFAGDARSGKTWLVSLLCERLILERYAVCVVDPEGDYVCLDALPGVIVHRVGRDDPLPDLERALRQPTLSVVLDLSAVPHDGKRGVVRSVLRRIDALRRAVGVPHRVVLDEAHYFLDGHASADELDPGLGGSYLVTYRSADLAPRVLSACDTIVATRITDRRLASRLLDLACAAEPRDELLDTLAGLPNGQAVLLRSSNERQHGIVRFSPEQRVTNHVRHRAKYVDVGVPPGQDFVFTRDGGTAEQRARTLREFLHLVVCVSDDLFHRHLVRGDFHRWIEDVIGDRNLGSVIRDVEQSDTGTARAAIVRAIRDRYVDPEEERAREPTPAARPTATSDRRSVERSRA